MKLSWHFWHWLVKCTDYMNSSLSLCVSLSFHHFYQNLSFWFFWFKIRSFIKFPTTFPLNSFLSFRANVHQKTTLMHVEVLWIFFVLFCFLVFVLFVLLFFENCFILIRRIYSIELYPGKYCFQTLPAKFHFKWLFQGYTVRTNLSFDRNLKYFI